MNEPHCEFCEKSPVWRYRLDGYVRFACDEHDYQVQNLTYIDLGERIGRERVFHGHRP